MVYDSLSFSLCFHLGMDMLLKQQQKIKGDHTLLLWVELLKSPDLLNLQLIQPK
jgi:hypothetical protein